ncbi:hypothetical protein [Aestuariibius sp. HNIBRBA575]|uniref:hypothetical protein n=1 Tax=Aestuariibius sp. HNIBRBA575 TaxID=3233343 RepID=UPI0034A1A874
MTIPKLKRIKVSTEQDLKNWVGQNPNLTQDVMIVTCNKTSRSRYLCNDQIDAVLQSHNWQTTRRYTLNGNLVGHVIRPVAP